jgi:hypothetical protein
MIEIFTLLKSINEKNILLQLFYSFLVASNIIIIF